LRAHPFAANCLVLAAPRGIRISSSTELHIPRMRSLPRAPTSHIMHTHARARAARGIKKEKRKGRTSPRMNSKTDRETIRPADRAGERRTTCEAKPKPKPKPLVYFPFPL
jgi:hypothetical protein